MEAASRTIFAPDIVQEIPSCRSPPHHPDQFMAACHEVIDKYLIEGENMFGGCELHYGGPSKYQKTKAPLTKAKSGDPTAYGSPLQESSDMDRPDSHNHLAVPSLATVRATPQPKRIGLAFLTEAAGQRRYGLAYPKGNPWPRIGRTARMTGLSGKTLIRCVRKGWIAAQGVRTNPGSRVRYFHLQTVYKSRIFTLAKAARYFGFKYEQIRWLYRSFMQAEARYATRLRKSHTYRINVFDLCRVLNREAWPSKDHLRLVEHGTHRSVQGAHRTEDLRRPNPPLRNQGQPQSFPSNRRHV